MFMEEIDLGDGVIFGGNSVDTSHLSIDRFMYVKA